MFFRIYTFNFKIEKKKKKKKKRKEKGISAENLTGYDDIVCEFAMCAFNLLDRVLNFSWLLIWI